jgi:hypothetical protein
MPPTPLESGEGAIYNSVGSFPHPLAPSRMGRGDKAANREARDSYGFFAFGMKICSGSSTSWM